MNAQPPQEVIERKLVPTALATKWAKDDRSFATWCWETYRVHPARINGYTYADFAVQAEERVREYERLYGDLA